MENIINFIYEIENHQKIDINGLLQRGQCEILVQKLHKNALIYFLIVQKWLYKKYNIVQILCNRIPGSAKTLQFSSFCRAWNSVAQNLYNISHFCTIRK
ncbi:hypothetical protein BpHYR1_031230 [Brachionus plicatilis]|uniref:Uncharacterized protein n=1 Tax=Brachionus plicatilis TaxID=10195 RepID=A0A3M7RKH6_BRAPC|nr:hypothetical protein BpHYR1_031230 [Brachionus plicatilis]